MTLFLNQISANKLALPQVTLCAVASVNVAATLEALRVSLEQAEFGDCKLFTDATIQCDHPGIDIVPIGQIPSSSAYSFFMLSKLIDHVTTSHVLVTQWDGHVISAGRWQPEFLEYDYIGARWPQFDDGHAVGNGGFSLRSRRLMEACQDPGFCPSHPEDLAIGRNNRDWLEARGVRFAPPTLADLFATERAGALDSSFGYHGVFNMPHAIGVKAFWDVYCDLDDLSTVRYNFGHLLRQVGRGRGGSGRAIRMIIDYLNYKLRDGY